MSKELELKEKFLVFEVEQVLEDWRIDLLWSIFFNAGKGVGEGEAVSSVCKVSALLISDWAMAGRRKRFL